MNKFSIFKKLLSLLLLLAMAVSMVGCDKLPFDLGAIFGGEEDKTPDEEQKDPSEDDFAAGFEIITIAEALEICAKYNGTASPDQYYIRGTVEEVTNPAYGEMTVKDATGSIYVFGAYAPDGTYYGNMEDKPYKGDEVILCCTLTTYNGTPEVKRATIVKFRHVEVEIDESGYAVMDIKSAREAAKGTKVKVKGVVARFTFANGGAKTGAIIVDNTQSIYVYDSGFASRVAVGDEVEICASKTYWILEKEQANAEKFGYMGCNQLESVDSCKVLSKGNSFDKTWITETTVKEILETPVTEDITTSIFKVNALITKVPNTGFTNYYINDLDGTTGSYVYTQYNGKDFGWMDEFDGKICTVYLVALNAKSDSTSCFFRFLPVEIIDEGYEFDTDKAGEYAVKYHGLDQFVSVYNADPALELITSVSSELLGFEGVTLSYSSSDEQVITFTTEEGKTVMHCVSNGEAKVTITGSLNSKEYSEEITIKVLDPDKIASITVAEAILAEVDSTVTVRGIVGPSVVNKDGFYLFGEDGSLIAVKVSTPAQFKGLAIGHEVIITGMRERHVKDDSAAHAGQSCIVDAEIIVNLYGEHEYSDAKFVEGKTIDELYTLDNTVDYSTTVFVVDAVIIVEKNERYTQLKVQSTTSSTTVTLYCSGIGQYTFLQKYDGQTVKLELAPCNWNDKNYWAFCALSVTTKDGKELNTLNFDSYS